MFNNADKVKYAIEIISAVAGLFIGLTFAFGFLIWNVYLQGLGFTSDDLFQARYILTGVLFVTLSFLIFGTVSKLRKFIYKKIESLEWVFLLLVFSLWLIFFSLVLFPFIPAELGGGFPRSVSLLATEDEISYLNKFGVPNGLGSLVQTANICLAYEDNGWVIIILNDRIISLKKQYLKGFGSLPSLEIVKLRFACSVVVLQKIWNLERPIQ